MIFGVCLILTPIYITCVTRTGKEAWTNGIMSVFAFLVWAYAFGGGLVDYLGWCDAPAGSVVLVLFILVSGAVMPVARMESVIPVRVWFLSLHAVPDFVFLYLWVGNLPASSMVISALSFSMFPLCSR